MRYGLMENVFHTRRNGKTLFFNLTTKQHEILASTIPEDDVTHR